MKYGYTNSYCINTYTLPVLCITLKSCNSYTIPTGNPNWIRNLKLWYRLHWWELSSVDTCGRSLSLGIACQGSTGKDWESLFFGDHTCTVHVNIWPCHCLEQKIDEFVLGHLSAITIHYCLVSDDVCKYILYYRLPTSVANHLYGFISITFWLI